MSGMASTIVLFEAIRFLFEEQGQTQNQGRNATLYNTELKIGEM